MSVGAIISAAAIGLMGSVGAGWQIFALYGVLYAVGFAATSVAGVSVLMSRWFPNNRGLASSVAITGNGTGQLVIIALLTSFLASIGLANGVHRARRGQRGRRSAARYVRNPVESPGRRRTGDAGHDRGRSHVFYPFRTRVAGLLDAGNAVRGVRSAGLLRGDPRGSLRAGPGNQPGIRRKHTRVHGVGGALRGSAVRRVGGQDGRVLPDDGLLCHQDSALRLHPVHSDAVEHRGVRADIRVHVHDDRAAHGRVRGKHLRDDAARKRERADKYVPPDSGRTRRGQSARRYSTRRAAMTGRSF